MTNKELRKLKRSELIELMLMQSRELDEQRTQRKELEKQLESRNLEIAEAGSIAEAAMQINHVFAAAQSAADQYLENVMSLQKTAEEESKEQERRCDDRCKDMVEEAKTQVAQLWKEIDDCLTECENAHPELAEPLQECRAKMEQAKNGRGAEADETQEDA